MPDEADERGCGQSADQGQKADGEKGDQTAAVADREPGSQETQVHQPFADKAVQRRQSGNRHRPEDHGAGRPRHGLHQAAESLHIPCARTVHDTAGGEEHQSLHESVIPDVEQPRHVPSTATTTKPLANPHSPTPRARLIKPMFSMLE